MAIGNRKMRPRTSSPRARLFFNGITVGFFDSLCSLRMTEKGINF